MTGGTDYHGFDIPMGWCAAPHELVGRLKEGLGDD